MMMSYETWLACIITAVEDIASREYQERAWAPGAPVWSSPLEVYLSLVDDCTFDLFFEMYGKSFTDERKAAWQELRGRLEAHYDQLPDDVDGSKVLSDPEWDVVRRSAERFLAAFS